MVASIDPFTGLPVGNPLLPGYEAIAGAGATPQAPLQPSPVAPPSEEIQMPVEDVFPVPPTPEPGSGYGVRAWNPAISAALDADATRTLEPARADDGTGDLFAGQARRITDAQRGVDAASYAAADIEARGLEARSRALEARLRMERDLESADRAAHDISMQEVRMARGRMEQQLAANRAMTVDPTLNFTAGESLGNAASLFAQGFLQAGYGIKIDVAGTLDRWTDRYVSNQLEKIRRGERLAEQDRVVWDMIRTEAADEADARERYRAFAMSQAATAMEVEASRWGAELPRAIAAQRAAEARMAFANQMNNLETGWYERGQAYKKRMFDEWATRRQLSIASTNANTARMEAEARMKPAVNAGDFLEDVTDSGQQQVKWQFKAGTNDTAKNEVKNRVAGQAALAYQMVQGMKIAKEAGPLLTQVTGLRGLHPEIQRRYAAWVDGVVQARVLMMSGKAATDTERKFIQQQFPIETWLTNGDNQKMYADFLDKTIDENQRFIDVHTDAVPGSDGKFATGEKALADMLRAESSADSAEEQAFDRATRPGGHENNQPFDAASEWHKQHGVPVVNGRVPDWSLDMQALHLAAESGVEGAEEKLRRIADRAFASDAGEALPERSAVAASILADLAQSRVQNQLTPAVYNQDGSVATWTDAAGNQYHAGPDGRPVR